MTVKDPLIMRLIHMLEHSNKEARNYLLVALDSAIEAANKLNREEQPV